MEEAVQAACAKQGKQPEQVTQLCLDSSCKSTHIKVSEKQTRHQERIRKKTNNEKTTKSDERKTQRHSREKKKTTPDETSGWDKTHPPFAPNERTIENEGNKKRGGKQ